MRRARIAITLDTKSLKRVDELVQSGLFPSRGKFIQDAVREKLERFRRMRFLRECAKLEAAVEQAAAEEFLVGETEWPEYS
jgi:metal-responsive CopG/Arc/MetJ family transcriptional regulator